MHKCNGVVVLAIAATASRAAVEVHTTSIVWDRFGEGPWSFSAQPVPMFDPMGGQRRLGRVRLDISNSWRATIALDNPLPEQQCIQYTPYMFEAISETNLFDWIPFYNIPPISTASRLGAPPMQRVTRTLTYSEGYFSDLTLRNAPEYFTPTIGTSLITFRSDRVGGGFDTFFIEDAEPDCSGGFYAGGPFGFSTVHVRFQIDITWTYHWIPSSCPVDLTTLSTPGSQFYGEPDGIVDSHDFFYYLDQFAVGNLAIADLTTNARPNQPGFGTPNGAITNDDFFYFLLKYAEGC